MMKKMYYTRGNQTNQQMSRSTVSQLCVSPRLHCTFRPFRLASKPPPFTLVSTRSTPFLFQSSRPVRCTPIPTADYSWIAHTTVRSADVKDSNDRCSTPHAFSAAPRRPSLSLDFTCIWKDLCCGESGVRVISVVSYMIGKTNFGTRSRTIA